MSSIFSKSLGNSRKRVTSKSANAYARFNIIYAVIAITPLAVTSIFNLAVDPYGIVKAPTFAGWNILKPAQDQHTRLFKSTEIIQLKPKRLILGSSTVMLGLNPGHSNLDHQSFIYNLGLTGAYMSDVRHYLDHALLNQPKIEQVILGLDFFMFNQTKQELNFDRQSFVGATQISLPKQLEINLSLDTLKQSINTVQNNLSDPKTTPYYYLGMRNEVNLDQLVKTTDTSLLFKKQMQNYLSGYYKNYQISQQSLADLQAIVEKCQKERIRLIVFISPLHAAQLEAIDQAGLWHTFEQWKQAIAQITPVWDFADYSSITTEPIDRKIEYFHDSVHYSQAAGDLILSRIFSEQGSNFPPNFGAILLPGQEYDSYFQAIRIRREQWRKENPQVVKMVEKLRQKI